MTTAPQPAHMTTMTDAQRSAARQAQLQALLPLLQEARSLLPTGDRQLNLLEQAWIIGDPDLVTLRHEEAKHWIDSFRNDKLTEIGTTIAENELQRTIRQRIDPRLVARVNEAAAVKTTALEALRAARLNLATHDRHPLATSGWAQDRARLANDVQGLELASQAAENQHSQAQNALQAAGMAIYQQMQDQADRAYSAAVSARERVLQAHAEAGHRLAQEHNAKVQEAQQAASALARARPAQSYAQ